MALIEIWKVLIKLDAGLVPLILAEGPFRRATFRVLCNYCITLISISQRTAGKRWLKIIPPSIKSGYAWRQLLVTYPKFQRYTCHSWDAFARITIDQISTSSCILARIRVAFVNICLAVSTFEVEKIFIR